MRYRLSAPFRAAVLTVAAILILSGCAQSPSVSSPASAPAPVPSETAPQEGPTVSSPASALPTLGYSAIVMTPVVDGSAAPTGEVAQPRAPQAVVYNKANGAPLALLPSIESVPVVGRVPGWVRVLLPSRRMLPSQSRPTGGVTAPRGTLGGMVNRGTGWIKVADLTITTGLPRVFVNKAQHRVDVVAADNTSLVAFAANIGAGVPEGPTFIGPGTGVASGCGDAAPIMLSAQSETEDGYRGQSISPIFIAGNTPACSYSPADFADMTPRMVQMSASDVEHLAPFLRPDIQVDIVSGAEPPLVTA